MSSPPPSQPGTFWQMVAYSIYGQYPFIPAPGGPRHCAPFHVRPSNLQAAQRAANDWRMK